MRSAASRASRASPSRTSVVSKEAPFRWRSRSVVRESEALSRQCWNSSISSLQQKGFACLPHHENGVAISNDVARCRTSNDPCHKCLAFVITARAKLSPVTKDTLDHFVRLNIENCSDSFRPPCGEATCAPPPQPRYVFGRPTQLRSRGALLQKSGLLQNRPLVELRLRSNGPVEEERRCVAKARPIREFCNKAIRRGSLLFV